MRGSNTAKRTVRPKQGATSNTSNTSNTSKGGAGALTLEDKLSEQHQRNGAPARSDRHIGQHRLQGSGVGIGRAGQDWEDRAGQGRQQEIGCSPIQRR